MRKVRAAANDGDYKQVIEDLKEYQSNFEEVVKENREQRPINTQPRPQKPLDLNAINYTSNPVASTYMGNLETNSVLPVAQRQFIDTGMWGHNSIRNSGNLHDAKELWKASSHDFNQSANYVNQNGNAILSVSQLPSKELQQIVSAKLKTQLGVNDALGVIFQPNSSLSKAIVNSKEFKDHIRSNLPKLIQGETIKEKNMYFGSDKNLALALGHADILYTTLDSDGNLYSLVLDTYDFNKDDKDWKVQIARDVQEAGIIRNYYTINVIFIPKYQLDRLL